MSQWGQQQNGWGQPTPQQGGGGWNQQQPPPQQGGWSQQPSQQGWGQQGGATQSQPPQQQWGQQPGPQGQWGPPQQQGQWGAQGQAGWGQPGYDPQAAGCCGPSNPQQPSALCPADPNQHCCNTNPNEPGMFQGCMQCCDSTMWAVGFFALATIVCFGVVLGTTQFDNLFNVYGVATTGQLEKAIYDDLNFKSTTDAPEVVNSSTTTSSSALPTFNCRRTEACSAATYAYSGSFGSLCMEDSMSAVAMVLNLSRWINFRGTLYFIAMLGTLVILILAVAVHRHKNPPNYSAGPVPPPPTAFFASPLYYMFRGAWATASVVIFLWVCTEMFQYWSFNAFYMRESRGKLKTFWRLFNEKFEWSVITVTIYLCWPLMHIALEIAFFFAGIIPWCAIRNMCYPQLSAPRDPEVPEDEQSCCVRTDNFYVEFLQARRLGFSDGQWRLITGHREPFFQGMDAPQNYGGGFGAAGGAQQMAPAGGPRPIPPPGVAGAQPPANSGWGQPQQQHDTPQRQDTMHRSMGSSQSGFFPQPSDAGFRSQQSVVSEDDHSDADASGRKKSRRSDGRTTDDETRKREKKEKKREKSEKKEKKNRSAE